MTPAHAPRPALPPRSLAEQQRLESALRTLMERQITFNRTLGLVVESFDPDAARVRFEMRDELVGHFLYGRLHGGVIAATLDTTGGFAIMLALARAHPADTPEQVMARFGRLGTIDLRTDFLRPGIGHAFVACARVTRLGGRIASTQMTLENDQGKLIATASAAYVVS